MHCYALAHVPQRPRNSKRKPRRCRDKSRATARLRPWRKDSSLPPFGKTCGINDAACKQHRKRGGQAWQRSTYGCGQLAQASAGASAMCCGSRRADGSDGPRSVPKSSDDFKTQARLTDPVRLKGGFSPEKKERRATTISTWFMMLTPADLDQVEQFARRHGWRWWKKMPHGAVSCSPRLSGFQRSIRCRPGRMYRPGDYRGRSRGPGPDSAELKDVVAGVFGLDDRPQVKPHLRHRGQRGNVQLHSNSNPASFTPPDPAKLYSFPDGGDGSGQCIGIIEIGGAYGPRDPQDRFQRVENKPPSGRRYQWTTAATCRRAMGTVPGPGER